MMTPTENSRFCTQSGSDYIQNVDNTAIYKGNMDTKWLFNKMYTLYCTINI